MANLYIQDITVPKDTSLWLMIKPDGTVHKIKNNDENEPAPQPGRAIVVRTPNGDLIERPNLSLVPDYKDVRNGLKRAIKETKRDGRVIAGLPIEMLEQTVVALDELRSVLRYIKNARVVVPAQETNTSVSSTTSTDTSSPSTSEFKIGSKVIFQSDAKHRHDPAIYPPVGTIGTIIGLLYSSSVAIVQWSEGTTYLSGQWACNLSDIKLV